MNSEIKKIRDLLTTAVEMAEEVERTAPPRSHVRLRLAGRVLGLKEAIMMIDGHVQRTKTDIEQKYHQVMKEYLGKKGFTRDEIPPVPAGISDKEAREIRWRAYAELKGDVYDEKEAALIVQKEFQGKKRL